MMARTSPRELSNPRILFLGALVFVFFVSAFVFSQYGFTGRLARDDAIYIYSGQQMAKGIPPYVSIFDHKGPLAPMISGIGVMLSQLVNTDDIMTVRATFFIISIFSVVGIFLLAYGLFDSSYRIAFLTSFAFVNFWGFGRHAASGPRAKTPMVLFQVLALWLTARRKWFLAGIAGSLAFLTWQPAVIFPLITILLAAMQSKATEARVKNVFKVVAGILIPLIVISLYFLYKGAFFEFVDGFTLFNINHLNRPGDTSLLAIFIRILSAVFAGYATMVIPILLGFAAILMVFIWRIRLHKSSTILWLSEDHFSALLISFPIPFVWSMLDFQWYADFFIFLPYAAVGFGWLLHNALRGIANLDQITTSTENAFFLIICGVLIIAAFANYRRTASKELDLQIVWSNEVTSRFGSDVKLVSIGVPEALVLLHKTNPNPYVFIINGIDNQIDAKTPGGFDGWLENLWRYQPDIIFYGSTNGKLKPKLEKWLESHYQETTIGEWKTYVKGDRFD